MLETLQHWDRALFRVFNGWHTPWLDGPMYVLTQTWVWVPFYLFLLWLAWQTLHKRIWLLLLLVALAVTLSDQTASGLLKPLVRRLRPCNDPLVAPVHIVNGYCSQAWSFASSHAANSATVAASCWLTFGRKRWWVAALLLGYWLVNSWTRIYLGVHFPGDILAGTCIGAWWALLLYGLQRRFLPKPI
ncbi:MAG: phosphatase PAP2 family protein [Bacteroidetes bacterium]|nr:phosphatase PAP2 family protein [Bacteroidota bacterium]